MKRLLIAATVLSLIGAGAASAQPRPYGDRDRDGVPNAYDRDRDGDGVRNDRDRNPNGPNHGGYNGGYRNGGDRDRDGIPNRYDRRDNRYSYGGRYYDRYRGPAYYYPRGYSYRTWGRGQRLPGAYFASPYYVDNWAAYRLRPPPRGYRYVRVGNDVVLAAIAGGLIAEVINGVFY